MRISQSITFLFFVITFEQSWKILLCESFTVSHSLLVQVGGFRIEVYYRHNRLYNFRGENTDCYTKITQLHIIYLVKEITPLLTYRAEMAKLHLHVSGHA